MAGSGEPGITVEGVWKKFRRGERHDSLRDLIPSLVRGLGRRQKDPAALEARDFWALRDVNLEIRPGQAIGIIGHNGAGKSTLLKLITRIMRPTLGRCEVRGRVGALIELAAGFHPDLTGRENVFLQGAIMGMPSVAIKARFDEIVEFSGIADFIDTPVKRYSSGMNARLGFAIAAHLDPDVLIIDEVLSVGDLAFQERAFGRMAEIVRSGIPVAVVSHQLDRVRELCQEAVLLEGGRVVLQASAADCIAAYVAKASAGDESSHTTIDGLSLDPLAWLGSMHLLSGERAVLRISGVLSHLLPGVRAYEIGFRVRSLQSGQRVFETWSPTHGVTLTARGRFALDVDLQLNVPGGLYQLEAWVNNAETSKFLGEVHPLKFLVEPGRRFSGHAQLNPRLSIEQGLADRH